MSTEEKDFLDYTSKFDNIKNQILFYSCIILGPIGIISNILNIIVCKRKKIRQLAMGFYSPIMSVFNMITLMFIYLKFLPTVLGAQNLFSVSDWSCVVYTFFGHMCMQISVWLNVMVSFDRMISITFPHKFSCIKDRPFLTKILLGLFVFISLMNVLDFTLRVNETPSTGNQSIATKSCSASNKIIGIIQGGIIQMMQTILPYIFVFGLNTILVYKIIESRNNLSIRRSLYRDYKFSFTIVMLNLIFFITQTPLLISSIYFAVLNYQQLASSTVKYLFNTFFQVNAFFFASCTISSVFFVNLAFNKNFKYEFYQLLLEFWNGSIQRISEL